MIAYPSFLPGPLLAGYTLNQQANLLRSEMDSGQARVRRRFKNVPSIIASTWLFTAEQASLFEDFIENTLDGGAAWFEMPVKTPVGMQTGTLRFVESPLEACTPLSIKLWQYTAKVELKTRPNLTTIAAADPALDNIAQFISDVDMSRYYP